MTGRDTPPAGSAGARGETAAVVAAALPASAAPLAVTGAEPPGPPAGAPSSTDAPIGTSVLANTAPRATAAPRGAATTERQRRSAPRRTGISTNR